MRGSTLPSRYEKLVSLVPGPPCPQGIDCALNSGAVHCFHCRRNWPPDITWYMSFEERPVLKRVKRRFKRPLWLLPVRWLAEVPCREEN